MTTVLTLTITGLAADSLAGGSGGRPGRRALAILAMFTGALASASLLGAFGLAAPLAVAASIMASLSIYLRSTTPSVPNAIGTSATGSLSGMNE